MTLLERWREADENMIIKEMHMLFANYSNALSLFTVDGNYDPVRYCVDHSENTEIETYGKKPAICYSEKTARKCIERILLDYCFLLIPFFRGDMQTIDIGVNNLPMPVAYSKNESNEETEIRNAVFVFEKCSNQSGFCVSKIIPLM